MGVRLEVDVECPAARFCPRLLKSQDFRMFLAVVGVRPLSRNVALPIGNDSSDVGVRRCQPDPLAGEFHSALKVFVSGVGEHAILRATMFQLMHS